MSIDWEAVAKDLEPAPGFAARVLARLPKASTGRLLPPAPAPGGKMQAVLTGQAARRRRYIRLWGTAAAAAILLSAGAWGLGTWMRSRLKLAEIVAVVGTPEAARTPWGRFQPVAKGEALPPGALIRTGEGALLRLRLPGGSLLDLGPGSRLRLDGPRTARLEDGRVWVSAVKDADSWVLDTPEGTVRTLGTVFSVALEETEKPATPAGDPDTPPGNPLPRSAP